MISRNNLLLLKIINKIIKLYNKRKNYFRYLIFLRVKFLSVNIIKLFNGIFCKEKYIDIEDEE